MSELVAPPFLEGLPIARKALEFAVRRHEGQRRESDAAPFILHPLEVASLLRNRGCDDEVVAAGILHDAVENTDATLAELEGDFGPRVCRLVAAVSDDESIEDYEAQKAALREQVARAGGDALTIYAADKLTKARELRARLTRDPAAAGDPALGQRLEHYEASREMLGRQLPDHPLVHQLGFELWALRVLPPATG